MTQELKTIEISNMPELLRIVEEVQRSRTPRVLRRRRKPLAILRPLRVAPKYRKRRKTEADRKAFLASAGGWRGLVDTEQLKKDIYESRKISSRPPITL